MCISDFLKCVAWVVRELRREVSFRMSVFLGGVGAARHAYEQGPFRVGARDGDAREHAG